MDQEALHIARTFNAEWAQHHFGRHPFGPLLLQDASLPWVRFHALPGSKRYAENAAEREIILARANELGDHLLGAEAPCWLVGTDFQETRTGWTLAGQYEDDIGVPDELIVPFFVQSVDWRSGDFDAELMSIAEDDERFLWIGRTSGGIFAPYDGGFDLFSPNARQIATLKAELSEWLSLEPSGL
jgi:hypothetical protein